MNLTCYSINVGSLKITSISPCHWLMLLNKVIKPSIKDLIFFEKDFYESFCLFWILKNTITILFVKLQTVL